MDTGYPFYGRRVGQWAGNWTTGVLAATLAADSPIGSIRCGPTQSTTPAVGNVPVLQTKVYITGLLLKVTSTVAFTAIQQFGLYLARFSGANMAAGATRDPLSLHSNSASRVDSVCKAGAAAAGDFRVSTTATLTTAGVTLDPVKIPVYGWSSVGPAEYYQQFLNFITNPIRLDVGEGLGLFNQIVWPAAGTAIVQATLFWDEANG